MCGVLLWAGVGRERFIAGRHTHSYGIAAGVTYGLVVTPNGRYIAISYFYEQKLHVYRLEADGQADGTATLLHTINTTSGAGMMPFRPGRMCLTPAGSLLLCDGFYDRVQELTGLGQTEPQHVRFIPVAGAWSIALHADTLAVGTVHCTIQLLSYASGAHIRSIGSYGRGPGQIGHSCQGIRFTPDGHFIVAAEYSNERLSMFRVSDGGFVKHIGAGVGTYGWKDVEFAPNGELLVVDYGNRRVCVFSADGDTLLRTWPANASVENHFKSQTALVLADYRLFGLDTASGSARVHVFE